MKKGYLYIILSAFIFSTMELVSKMIASIINPYQLTFVRFLIGGLILLPFAIKDIRKQSITFKKDDYKFFATAGLLCIAVSMSFFQLAVVYTKASTVAIVFSTNPIFTVPLAYLILKENVSKKMILSLVTSVIGIIFIFNPLNLSPDFKGISLAFLAAFTFSLYSVFSKPKIEKYGGTVLTCFTFIFGDIIMLFILITFRIPIISGINLSNLPHLIYLGVIVTGIGYVVYFAAMKHTSAVATSIMFFIKPALAPLLSFIILGENIPINTLIGMFFILVGSYISLNSKMAYENT